MSPRRLVSFLGLGALAGGFACACLPWRVEAPGAVGFVSRSLSELHGVTLSARDRIEIALLPMPRLSFDQARLSSGAEGPALAEGGRLTIQLKPLPLLFGRAEPIALVLDGGTVSLPESDEDIRWRGPTHRVAERWTSGSPSHPRRLLLRGVTVTGRDPRDGSPQTARNVELALSWPLWSEALALSASFSWKDAPARIEMTGLRPDELALGRSSPFATAISWPHGTFTAEGQATGGDGMTLTGQGSLRIRSLPETLAWIGGGVALSPLVEDMSVEGGFEASAAGLLFPQVQVRIGNNLLEGAGSASFDAQRPAIRATLAADEINLSPLLGGLVHLFGAEGAEDGWSNRPIGLNPLTGGDLDLRLSAGSARIGPVRLGEIAASVLVRKDAIEASLGRANLQGGLLKGRLALYAAQPGSPETEMKAQASLDRADLGALLVELGEEGWLLGATQFGLNVEGRGHDPESLMRRIRGRANLVIQGGALAGIDLADVIHRKGALARGALARRNNRTPFDRASVNLAFADGIGEIVDGAMTARSITAGLHGRVSLPDRRLEARAELLARTASAGDAVPQAVTLFEIAGPWSGIAVKARTLGNGTRDMLIGETSRVPAAVRPELTGPVRAYAP